MPSTSHRELASVALGRLERRPPRSRPRCTTISFRPSRMTRRAQTRQPFDRPEFHQRNAWRVEQGARLRAVLLELAGAGRRSRSWIDDDVPLSMPRDSRSGRSLPHRGREDGDRLAGARDRYLARLPATRASSRDRWVLASWMLTTSPCQGDDGLSQWTKSTNARAKRSPHRTSGVDARRHRLLDRLRLARRPARRRHRPPRGRRSRHGSTPPPTAMHGTPGACARFATPSAVLPKPSARRSGPRR